MEYWPNGDAMGRYGLILWENGATGSRKVLRCLLDLWEAIFQLSFVGRTPKSKVQTFQYFPHDRVPDR